MHPLKMKGTGGSFGGRGVVWNGVLSAVRGSQLTYTTRA